MADTTEIAWTDSTFNPWWGCTRVADGCDFCYAAALDKRTGGDHWGADKEYRVMSDDNWKKPLQWERRAELFLKEHKRRRKVFCASMADVFDNKAPEGQRQRLWELIKSTPSLDWQILTKRAVNLEKFLPDDWGYGYQNVWLGVTVENIKHGIPRIEFLRRSPSAIKFLSVEPLLEDLGELDLSGIDWVIVGGESGSKARPMKKEWMINIRNQCLEQKVPFFFKQWGAIVGKGGCEIDGYEIKEWPKQLVFKK
jgi:protein gp37